MLLSCIWIELWRVGGLWVRCSFGSDKFLLEGWSKFDWETVWTLGCLICVKGCKHVYQRRCRTTFWFTFLCSEPNSICQFQRVNYAKIHGARLGATTGSAMERSTHKCDPTDSHFPSQCIQSPALLSSWRKAICRYHFLWRLSGWDDSLWGSVQKHRRLRTLCTHYSWHELVIQKTANVTTVLLLRFCCQRKVARASEPY